MTSSPTPAVLPDARARHTWDRFDRPRTCEVCGYVEHDGSGIGFRPCATPPESDAAVPAGEVLGPLWRKVQQVQSDAMRHDWSVEDYRAGMAATLGIAAAPKVASDTGAGLPRLTRAMMRAACKAHYGDDNIDGISLTVGGHDYNFAQGFARMWKGVRKALATPTDATDGAGLHHENELLRVALNEIDVIAGTTTPPDGDAAAWRALEDIIKLIHPFRTNGAHPPRAALATDATDGASKRVDDAADAILADVRGRRLLKLLFREDANTNATPVGWIDASIDLETQRECATAWARIALAAAPKRATGTEAASRIERVAQAIYEASGSLIDQNGFIPWADLDGTTDADSYRRMAAAAALATPTDATDGATGGGEVPQGMKPWASGDYGPSDYTGGDVLLRNGRRFCWMPLNDLRWKHATGDGAGEDVVAYTARYQAPATTPGGDLLEQAVTHLVNVLAADGGPRGDAAFKAARDWWTAYDRRAFKPAGDGGEA